MVRIAAVFAMVGVGLLQPVLGQQVAVVTEGDRAAKLERLEKMAAEQGQQIQDLKTRTERVTTGAPEPERVAEIRKVVAEMMQDASFRESLYPAATNTGYDNKRGFYIDSADQTFALNIKGYTQVRYNGIIRQKDNPTLQGQQRRDNVNAFEIERLFLAFFGYIGSPKVMYRIVVDGGTTGWGGGGFEDNNWFTYYAHIDYEYMKDQYITAGLIQPPFGGQAMTSGALLQMVDRSMAMLAFGFDRALGVMAHGNLFERRMSYFAAITNGIVNPDDRITTPTGATELDTNFGYYAKLCYYALGKSNSLAEIRAGYPESDLAYSKDPELRFGTAFLYNDDNGDAHGGFPGGIFFAPVPDKIRSGRGIGGSEPVSSVGTSFYSVAVDSQFKYRGFSVNLEYYLRMIDGESEWSQWERRTLEDGTVHQQGGHLQVGYFIVPKRLELCGRVGGIWDNGSDNAWEYGVGCNYFPFGTYNLRIGADIMRVDEVVGGGSSSPNYGLNDDLTMVRVVLQAGF